MRELDIITYLRYRRDAFIYGCRRTEKGQEYLDKCWMLEQTEPDRTALRETFGGKGD